MASETLHKYRENLRKACGRVAEQVGINSIYEKMSKSKKSEEGIKIYRAFTSQVYP